MKGTWEGGRWITEGNGDESDESVLYARMTMS
jgi:hypothetical protein